MNAADIKPKKRGQSDFFSWQLYRWARDKPDAMQIWRGTWNPITGVDRAKPVLYIGRMYEDLWFSGRWLPNLCLRGQSIESYAYGPGHDTKNWEEVTDEWWAKYLRIGVCAIHGDSAHNWHQDEDIRTCRNCGKKEHRVTETVERQVWRAA